MQCSFHERRRTKAEVLALNLRNLVMYRAASKADALRCANALGKHWVERASWQPEDFRRLKGIGRAKGQQLAALIEIGRRMIKQPAGQAPVLNRPELVAAHVAPYARGLEVEKFWVLCLNRKNRLKKLVEVTSGTATAALAHPREVFRHAVQHGATGIACVHNHPSGDPAPSSADVQVTRQLREAARALDIELMDHVVIGTAAADPTGLGYYSFRSVGLL